MGRYRPYLDGLRGVAVALVMTEHFAGAQLGMPGLGGVGVALFFALSGYLITTLLLEEAERRGRVDLLGFYARRAARLMPALVVMVAVTAPLLAGRYPIGRNALAALTYSTNYAVIWHKLSLSSSPWLHTWSLAVEEHFYLLWAPVVVFAFRRRGAAGVERAAWCGVAFSTVFRFAVAFLASNHYGHAAEWVVWGSVARGDSLLIGCAFAVAVRRGVRASRLMTVCALGGLVYLIFDGLGHLVQPKLMAVQSTLVAWCCAVAVLALLGSPRAQSLLSWRPLVATGKVSYSLYLWHFPLLGALAGRMPRLAILGLSVAVAVGSYLLVEKPIRGRVRVLLDRRSGRDDVCSQVEQVTAGPDERQRGRDEWVAASASAAP